MDPKISVIMRFQCTTTITTTAQNVLCLTSTWNCLAKIIQLYDWQCEYHVPKGITNPILFLLELTLKWDMHTKKICFNSYSINELTLWLPAYHCRQWKSLCIYISPVAERLTLLLLVTRTYMRQLSHYFTTVGPVNWAQYCFKLSTMFVITQLIFNKWKNK